MKEKLILLGFITVFIGIILIILGTILTALESKKTKVEWGFGGFIGFLPFGYWSSKRMMYLVIISLFLLTMLFILLTRKF